MNDHRPGTVDEVYLIIASVNVDQKQTHDKQINFEVAANSKIVNLLHKCETSVNYTWNGTPETTKPFLHHNDCQLSMRFSIQCTQKLKRDDSSVETATHSPMSNKNTVPLHHINHLHFIRS